MDFLWPTNVTKWFQLDERNLSSVNFEAAIFYNFIDRMLARIVSCKTGLIESLNRIVKCMMRCDDKTQRSVTGWRVPVMQKRVHEDVAFVSSLIDHYPRWSGSGNSRKLD